MSVYKEGFYGLELIQKRSKQIWNDAADYGVPVSKGDEIWDLAKQLTHFYGEEGTRKEHQYETGATLSQQFSMMDEWQTGDTFVYRLTYVAVKGGIKVNGKKFDGYLYVEHLNTIPGYAQIDL